MSRNLVFLIVALVLIGWIVLAWFTGSWLGLEGWPLIFLRASLILLGVIGAAGFVWLYLRQHGPAPTNASNELEIAFREADARLTSSGHAARAKIAQMPALLLTGEDGSAKTSITVHSGLEADLLSGQVYQDRDIIPTRGANIWYSDQNIFIELGGAQLDEPASRAELLKRLVPKRLKSMVGGGGQAPRAAVVCVDGERFLQSGGAESTAAEARKLNVWLTEIAQKLGIRLPVYVLFTKMDRVPHFREFVANLSLEEAAQVFGATLPLADPGAGSYSERETRRLSVEFDGLYRSLADLRPDLLSREHEPTSLPSAYEFPREFRKLRGLLIQFLVDLCRPSQLHTSPFLRGFYFTGVRPWVVHDVVMEQPARREEERADATQIFQPGQLSPQPVQTSGGGRRVPQWVFLNKLFSDVILRDQTAQSSSGASVKASKVRRFALAAATALALILCIAWTVSWFGNRALVSNVTEATEELPALTGIRRDVPSLDELERLDAERQQLEQLATWRQEGAPWRIRWGLYVGDALYPDAARAYFETFRRMLLRSTQESLVSFMSRPAQEAESAQSLGYRPVYDALKAYLITTSHPDKSTEVFLAPVLREHWRGGRSVDEERLDLIERQFAFYARVLPVDNPFLDAEPEAQPVATARAYLARFAATEAIYAAMQAAAGESNPAFVFNALYPGSSTTVVNNYAVPGAFTRGGWDFMQKAIDQPDEFFAGEEWVLGNQSIGNVDIAKLQADLRERYRADFIMYWRNYLDQTNVVRYGSLKDAATKLGTTSGNRSPLLLAICAVAENTNVDDDEIKQRFQPAALVGAAPCSEQPAKSENQGYRNGLISLQASLDQLDGNREDQNAFNAASNSAREAQVAVRQLAGSFPIDQQGGVDKITQQLLEDPIRYAQSLVEGVPRQGVNSGSQAFCGQFRALISKYPFNKDASKAQSATLSEFDGIFRPGDGAMWRMYNGNLDQFLVRQGNQYVANRGGAMRITSAFETFFNRLAAISRAFYPENAQQANLTFGLRPNPRDTVGDIHLTIDGRTADYNNGRGGFAQFSWPGSGNQEALMQVKFSGGSQFDVINYQGLWAPFSMFLEAESWSTNGGQATMQWTASTSAGPMIIDGQPATVGFVLDMNGGPPVFSPGYLSGLRCVANAVQ